MTRKTNEMFNHLNQISNTISKFSSLQDKMDEITKTSGPLWYIFGSKLESKPWLTYQERFCNEITVAYHKNGQITEMVIKNDIF